MQSERDFLDWLRPKLTASEAVELGIGDDCAVMRRPAGKVLITTDALTEGVDFFLRDAGARAIGRKAMAVNLSDIAAMGGRPTAALVNLILPKTFDGVRELYEGILEVANRYSCPIIGGDTNSWDGGLVVAITVLGEPIHEPIRRDGAKPGDLLFVTGPLGGSILGRHLNPIPRLDEVAEILKFVTPTAMIDISDGLARDVRNLCRESQCGAMLVSAQIPIHPDAECRAKQTGKLPLEHALGDGEDFELLFTVSPVDAEKFSLKCPHLATRIGSIVESGFWLDERELPDSGWGHSWSTATDRGCN